MNIFQRFAARVGRFLQRTSGVMDPERWLVDYVRGGSSSSGVRVTIEGVYGLPAAWNGISTIAGHVGQIDFEVRRRTATGSERDVSRPADRLLNRKPNDLMTGHVFKQTMQAHALLTGNARAVIIRDLLGQPTELILVQPSQAYTLMWEGEKWHMVWFDSRYLGPRDLPYGPSQGRGSIDGSGQTAIYKIPDKDVLHIPGLGYNGLWGYNIVDVAKDAFGVDSAGLNSAGYSFRNNGRPSLVLEAPIGVLPTKKEAEEMLAAFRAAHEGVDNTARTGILREGVTAKPIPVSSTDLQFLESRRFSRQDIALLLGTEYLMGESAAVYKDLAERQSAYVTNTLARWGSIWASEVERKLFSANVQDSGSHYLKANYQQLVKGSPNTLADYTGKLRQQGVINGNEAREMHGFNRVEDPALEEYTNPNITTDEPAEGGEEEDSGSETSPDANDNPRARNAIRYLFASTIKSERRRILGFAGRDNFASRIAKFYENHREVLYRTCDEVNVSRAFADAHVRTSVDEVLELAAVTDQFGLADVLEDATKNWEDRAEEFCDAL